jgi:hypothetical protein
MSFLAYLLIHSGSLAAMGRKDLALDALKRGNEHPQSSIFDAADMDNVTSDVHRHLGQLVNSQALPGPVWTSGPGSEVLNVIA